MAIGSPSHCNSLPEAIGKVVDSPDAAIAALDRHRRAALIGRDPGFAEATANARESAQQFATDSRTALGGIRQASQGVFVILPRDQAPGVNESGQLQKIVRVVSTVQYFLR
jgi:hypothetical protein